MLRIKAPRYSSPSRLVYPPSFTFGSVCKYSPHITAVPNSARSRYKAWKLIGLHPLCAVLLTAGYALREYGAFNYMYDPGTPNLIIFVLSQVLIFVCP